MQYAFTQFVLIFLGFFFLDQAIINIQRLLNLIFRNFCVLSMFFNCTNIKLDLTSYYPNKLNVCHYKNIPYSKKIDRMNTQKQKKESKSFIVVFYKQTTQYFDIILSRFLFFVQMMFNNCIIYTTFVFCIFHWHYFIFLCKKCILVQRSLVLA